MSLTKNLAFVKILFHSQGTADAFSHDAKALAVAGKVSVTTVLKSVEGFVCKNVFIS